MNRGFIAYQCSYLLKWGPQFNSTHLQVQSYKNSFREVLCHHFVLQCTYTVVWSHKMGTKIV